jgi:hypothetical protein
VPAQQRHPGDLLNAVRHGLASDERIDADGGTLLG